MKIIDNRKKKNLKPEEIFFGEVYKVILTNKKTYIIMLVNPNIDIEISMKDFLVVDLKNDNIFIINYDEFVEIEKLNAKLVID